MAESATLAGGSAVPWALLCLLVASLSLTSYLVLTRAVGWARIAHSQVLSRLSMRLQGMFVLTDARRVVGCYLLVVGAAVVLVLAVMKSVAWLCVVLVLAGVLPKLFLAVLEQRRRTRLVNALPDALSNLAATLKAGSTLINALQVYVDENKDELAQEFALVLREIRLGARQEDALDHLAERVQCEDVDLLVAAAMIAKDVGGNLAEVLMRLSGTLRRKLEMEGRIGALTAQGVMQGWVVGLLPLLVLVALQVLEPEAMAPLFSSILGWISLALIVVLELVGGLLIRRIIRIDV